jgi:ribonucleoside-triphosphate reductase
MIIKRNGTRVKFDKSKIEKAILSANKDVDEIDRISIEDTKEIANYIEENYDSDNCDFGVEEIQDLVEEDLMDYGYTKLAREYIKYRYKRKLIRKANSTDENILGIIDLCNEEIKEENSNKNPTILSTQRDYMAGEVSKDLTERLLLPKEIIKAHKEGIIHFHDMDYFAQHSHNCDLINLDDMLQNGTVINGRAIHKPHSFRTACTIMTQIAAQVASVQYGGQSMSLTHLAPFVRISKEKITKDVEKETQLMNPFGNTQYSEAAKNEIINKRLKEEITAGVQTIQYQIETIMSSNGQSPFITLFMYLNETEEYKEELAMIIEEVLKQRYEGIENEKGVKITPAFPKLIYVLEEDNITEDSKYWYLTELAAKCSARRLVPDYISEKMMKELKGDVYTCMGCRSFLTPDRFTDKGVGNIANAKNYKENQHKYYGRFNQGVVTINLPDVALSAQGDYNKFWKIFDERLELCYQALMYRHNRLKGTISDVAPILWQNGALARLNKGETIDKLLFNGYSTISLGYAGLYECVKAMTGESHTSQSGKPFALEVMQHMNDKCNEWKAKTNIDFSLYGTPLESTTYKFAKCLQNRFGIIKDITDHNYITNSYHVNVREEIDAFTKLKFESEFQALSPGGAISYVEVPNMQDNIPAILQVIKFIYNNIMYAELNTKSDYCQCCGYDGEIVIKEKEDGYLYWQCPNCGNTDQNKMSVARRTCGLTNRPTLNRLNCGNILRA